MNNPKFYMFGVPDGFDFFQGSANDKSYFQDSFYDRSQENTKLVIHRKVNGEVSYSYLKYRFLSCESRLGAFFGMSVVFTGEYCKDTAKLYRLFEFAYNIILENKTLLEEIKGNANSQGKFLIHTFSEQEAKIRNIENTVLVNIKDNFANDICPIDSSFVQGKANVVRKINTQQDNKVIVEALQTYSWVSYSPDYPVGKGFDGVTEEGIRALEKTADKIKDVIIENHNLKTAKPTVVYDNSIQLQATTADILKTIQSYIKNQPELQELKEKYQGIQKQLNDLIKSITKPDGTYVVSVDCFNGGTTIGSGSYEKGARVTVSATANKGYSFVNWTKNGQPISVPAVYQFPMPAEDVTLVANFEQKTKIGLPLIPKKALTWGGIVVAAVLFIVVLWNIDCSDGKTPNTTDCPECKEYLNQGDSLMIIHQYSRAKTAYKKAEDKMPDYVADKMKDLNNVAMFYGKQAAQTEFDKFTPIGKIRKVECYQNAVNELNKWKEFDNDNEIQTIQADYLKKTIDFYADAMSKANGSKKIDYANQILSLDANNATARAVITDNEAKKAKAEQEKRTAEQKKREEEQKKKDCYVKTSDYKTFLATKLLDELKRSLEKKEYLYVIKNCEIIKTTCPNLISAATALQNKATALQDKAKTAKEIVVANPAFTQ